MIQSRFSKWAFVPLITSITIISVVIVSIVEELAFFDHKTPIFFTIFFSIIFLWVLVLQILGELRTKTIVVNISAGGIQKRGFLGVGPKTEYDINKLEGYKLSTSSSKAGDFEYLYCISKGKKVVKLSEFYHKNYGELKTSLQRKGLKNLGTEYWSVIRDTIESFQ